MQLSVVIVHYHTPELLAEAIAALGPSLESVSSECLIVDNGSADEDRTLFDSLPARRIDPGRNLGYAGGINLGVERSRGEIVVAMNPDVLVAPVCIERLMARIEAGADVVGPRFYLDRDHRLLIPPTELRTRSHEMLGALATRSQAVAGWARRLWRGHARRHWMARDPIASWSLSGALLAFRREAWLRVGVFDEGYRLYFEESDWLQRARRTGLLAEYVAAATAVHLYDQAAQQEPSSRRWFDESAQRYRRRYLGRTVGGLVGRLEAPAGSDSPPKVATPKRSAVCPATRESGAWLELSPHQRGFPAVAEWCDSGSVWRAPRTLGADPPGRLFWGRWVDERGKELTRGIPVVLEPEPL